MLTVVSLPRFTIFTRVLVNLVQPKHRQKKITLVLYMGQKLASKKVLRVTIAYPKEHSEIKGKFFKKILTQK